MMIKFIKSFLFFLVFIRLGLCSEIDYNSFNSIDEVIRYETSCILNTTLNDFEKLSDGYADLWS
jgi:hypothetical protein